jgi:hypothetical protein
MFWGLTGKRVQRHFIKLNGDMAVHPETGKYLIASYGEAGRQKLKDELKNLCLIDKEFTKAKIKSFTED